MPTSLDLDSFDVKILRQDHPTSDAYWQVFWIDYETGLNITSVLQKIAARSITVDDEHVTPVAYDANCLEEVGGSCTMVINGSVRQACSALADRLLKDHPGVIELRPMSKFPVVCPKEIPLMHYSWGRVGRAATVHVIKGFFDGGS